MATNQPAFVLCFDGAATYWIEEFDSSIRSNVSQVVSTYDTERDALEGLARARAQQAVDYGEYLSHADALIEARREVGL